MASPLYPKNLGGKKGVSKLDAIRGRLTLAGKKKGVLGEGTCRENVHRTQPQGGLETGEGGRCHDPRGLRKRRKKEKKRRRRCGIC